MFTEFNISSASSLESCVHICWGGGGHILWSGSFLFKGRIGGGPTSQQVWCDAVYLLQELPRPLTFSLGSPPSQVIMLQSGHIESSCNSANILNIRSASRPVFYIRRLLLWTVTISEPPGPLSLCQCSSWQCVSVNGSHLEFSYTPFLTSRRLTM